MMWFMKPFMMGVKETSKKQRKAMIIGADAGS
jgi:hypothetical protein